MLSSEISKSSFSLKTVWEKEYMFLPFSCNSYIPGNLLFSLRQFGFHSVTRVKHWLIMTGTHSESNLAVLDFLANEFTWGGVRGCLLPQQPPEKKAAGVQGCGFPLLFHRWLSVTEEAKYTPLPWPSAPPCPCQHTTAGIATELSSYHIPIESFHQTLSIEETDSSYIQPAMNKNKPAKKKNVYGHSCYTHILRSQLHDKCWGYKDKGCCCLWALKCRRWDQKKTHFCRVVQV